MMRWQTSTTATYRLPLWWPPEMVLVPAVETVARSINDTAKRDV